MSEILPIHTLNARDFILLEVMRDYSNMSPERVLIEIQKMRKQLVKILAVNGIPYEKLSAALVPSRKKLEVALVFDSLKIDNSFYGYEVFRSLIPNLDISTNHSILCGDYGGEEKLQTILYKAFNEAIKPVQDIDYRHSTQFFIVYINNLSEIAFQRLVDGIRAFEGFVGYANTTYSSIFKSLLSMRLVNLALKYDKRIIQGNEDDNFEVSQINMSGYPFEKNGYKCLSIPSYLMGLLLSYKIERPVFEGFEEDTEFSINAVNSKVFNLDNFDIQVEDEKLEYIRENKSGLLNHAQLVDITKVKLQKIIRGKIRSNYIYNLAYLEEYNVTKFSIIIEIVPLKGKPFRLMAVLEYNPDQKLLRLITLY